MACRYGGFGLPRHWHKLENGSPVDLLSIRFFPFFFVFFLIEHIAGSVRYCVLVQIRLSHSQKSNFGYAECSANSNHSLCSSVVVWPPPSPALHLCATFSRSLFFHQLNPKTDVLYVLSFLLFIHGELFVRLCENVKKQQTNSDFRTKSG